MRLTILFGGASFEHEISIVSAITLKEKLAGFELSFVFCDGEHRFYLIESSKMKATVFSKGEYKKMPELTVSHGAFVQKTMFGATNHDGVVLNLIHGADGEDGTISSLLEFFSLRYIGPRMDASIFSYDKRYTKWLCKAKNISCVDYEIVSSNQQTNLTLSYPVIVKPSRLGSSIGVSIVKDESELDYALDVAFEFDEIVVIESFIKDVKEYNLAGYMADGEIYYSIVEEPQKEEFLDFEKKYMDFSRSDAISKADIDEKLESKLKNVFAKVYRDMFEGSLIRCDFFVVDDKVVLNEINPIPGSMANYLFDDFASSIKSLATSLPRTKKPKITYEYIHSISQAKGK